MSIHTVDPPPSSASPGFATSQAIGNSDPWMRAMRAGDFATAFAISDSVLRSRDRSARDNPRLPYHLRWVWDGTPLEGRDVLVRCYHGLGDTLQFCRFLPVLRARARSLHVETQASLLPLLVQVPGVDRWIAFRDDRPVPPREADVEIMELAHALRLTPYEVPPPRLSVPPVALAPRPSWGACWRAGGWEPGRSVPVGSLLDAIRCEGRALVSLQHGPGAVEATGEFLNPGDSSDDIMRAASLLAGVDVVVTVDTMVAHLAGTLGRPTILLLKADADWRWMDRADSPWYPSVRLLRQHAPGDWGGPLRALKAAS